MMNSGFTKLNPAKKDPMRRPVQSAASVSSKLRQRIKPVPRMGGAK
jgi:hypothetical protein